MLGQTYTRLAKSGVVLGFSYVHAEGAASDLAKSLTLTGEVADDHLFETTDHALEAFEEELLEKLAADWAHAGAWTVSDFATSFGLDEEECAVLADVLQERRYEAGDVVCRQGEQGDSMFLVSHGSAEVTIPILELSRRRRLATLTPGTFYGEMSLLDGLPRSADVQADGPLVCFELTLDAFERLREHHPQLAMKIYTAIGRILGGRLRDANALITELDA